MGYWVAGTTIGEHSWTAALVNHCGDARSSGISGEYPDYPMHSIEWRHSLALHARESRRCVTSSTWSYDSASVPYVRSAHALGARNRRIGLLREISIRRELARRVRRVIRGCGRVMIFKTVGWSKSKRLSAEMVTWDASFGVRRTEKLMPSHRRGSCGWKG